jgi:glutamate-1-semialdehyde aminotransferase
VTGGRNDGPETQESERLQGGAQKLLDVTPDLAAFGKAMAGLSSRR